MHTKSAERHLGIPGCRHHEKAMATSRHLKVLNRGVAPDHEGQALLMVVHEEISCNRGQVDVILSVVVDPDCKIGDLQSTPAKLSNRSPSGAEEGVATLLHEPMEDVVAAIAVTTGMIAAR